MDLFKGLKIEGLDKWTKKEEFVFREKIDVGLDGKTYLVICNKT
jgi:hypothetical protein